MIWPEWLAADVAVTMAEEQLWVQARQAKEAQSVPACVAYQTGTQKLLAIGSEAAAMFGKDTDSLKVYRVFNEGSFDEASHAIALFSHALRMALPRRSLISPRLVVVARSMPRIQECAQSIAHRCGARGVYICEFGMATAIGLGLAVHEPCVRGVMHWDQDWFEFGVFNLAGVLAKCTGAIGVGHLIDDIRCHVSLTQQLLPDRVELLERVKTGGLTGALASELPGWEAWLGRSESGRRRSIEITSDTLLTGATPSVVRVAEVIKECVRKLARDQFADLTRTEIFLTGTGADVPGLAGLLASHVGLKVAPKPNRVPAAVLGAHKILGELELLCRASRVR